MKSDKVILVAGGDLRQQYAAQRLRQKTGAAVWTVGLPVQPNLHFAETPAEVPAYDVLVLPVLAGNSGETVPAPFGTSPLSLSELAAQGKPAALVAGGGCSGVAHWFEAAGMTVTDYLRREELCLANAVPTAEGAIRIAMEETARTLHGASALVVGYGRIGMALAPRLRALGMQTEICARRCETRALAQMQGFSAVPVSALAQRAAAADVIFNTVPVLLLSETVLKALPPETLVIDLASRPGGTDFDAAKRLGTRVVWALALPPEVRRCHIPEKAVSAESHRKNVEKSVESVLNSEKRLRNCEKATKTGIISSKEF